MLKSIEAIAVRLQYWGDMLLILGNFFTYFEEAFSRKSFKISEWPISVR